MIPGLTARGEKYALVLVAALVVLGATNLWSYRAGGATQRTKDDEAAAAAIHVRFLAAQKAASVREREFHQAVAITVKDKPAHVRAIATTDTALAGAQRARESAERSAQDSAATVATLRASLDSLAVADSILAASALNERSKAAKRLADDSTALAKADSVVTAMGLTITLAVEDHAADRKVIGDLKGQRHGFLRRAANGVLIVACAGGLGAIGSLASPVGTIAGAIIGAAVCGVIVR